MYFKKYVRLSTFQCSDFTLSDEASSSTNTVSLGKDNSCVITTTSNNYIITFDFPLSELTTTVPTIISSLDAWIYIPHLGSTTDLNNNALLSIDSYYSIENGPQVVGFILDLNTGLFTFSFSKPIDITQSFDTSAIGLYNSWTLKKYILESNHVVLTVPPTLTCSPGGSNMSNFGSFYLSYNDLLNVKLLLPNQFNLQLLINFPSMSSLVLKDSLNKVVRNRDITIHPLLVSRLIPNIIPPSIVNTVIDLSSNRFVIKVTLSS